MKVFGALFIGMMLLGVAFQALIVFIFLFEGGRRAWRRVSGVD